MTYDKIRERNIENRRRLFNELQISQAKSELASSLQLVIFCMIIFYFRGTQPFFAHSCTIFLFSGFKLGHYQENTIIIIDILGKWSFINSNN